MTSKVVIDAQTNPIKSVTVFRSNKAEVIRSFQVDLQDGQNDIVLSNLPICVVLDSIRVQGVANATLFDVSTTLPTYSGNTAAALEKEKSQELKDLEERQATLVGEKRIRDLQAHLLVGYSGQIQPEFLNADDVFAYLDNFYDYGKANLAHIAKIDKELKDIAEKIALEKEKTSSFGGAKFRGLKINLLFHAKVAGQAQFTLSYLVTRASWDPVYDLRATTENGIPSKFVKLDYRASIKQSTGEDWKNVALSLSTAQDDKETVVPAMRQLKLTATYGAPEESLPSGSDSYRQGRGFGNINPASAANLPQPAFAGGLFAHSQMLKQQQQQQQQQQQSQQQLPPPTFASYSQAANAATTFGGFGATATHHATTGADEFVVVPPAADGGVTGAGAGAGETEENPIQSLAEAKAVATDNSISAMYTVEGLSNIPSDNSPHRVALTELTFDATPRYIAVPKMKKTAFLDCRVTNSSSHHILPGPANIYLNDGYITKASIPYVPPQDSFACSLGPDRNLRLEYSHSAVKKPRITSNYAAKEETYSHTIKIKVTNNKSTPLGQLFLRDMLPTSDDDRVKIVLTEPAKLIEAGADDVVDVKENVRVRWRKVKDGSSGEKVGWVEWLCADIQPQGELQLEMKCDVTGPSDMAVLDPGTYALYKQNAFKV